MKQDTAQAGQIPPIGKKVRHLLVIRLSAMGDVAMTVPVLSALTQQYPHLRITVLTKPFFAPLFHQLQNVEVYEAEVKGGHKGVLGLWNLYKELQALHIDAVADLHNVLRSKILKLYFRSGGIPVIHMDKGRSEKKALTSSKSKDFKPLKTTHERYADVFAGMGFPVDLSKARPLSREELSEDILQRIKLGNGIETYGQLRADPMDTHTASSVKKWLGIAPFAAFEGKMYPLALMEAVIRALEDTEKYKIFLFGGGKKEIQKLERLETHYGSCTNVAGQLSFPEQLALISNLDAMLSMDSGNGHLAAMYGIPVITVWGVTHPYAGFAPFGQAVDNALLANRDKFPLIPTSVYGNKMPEGYENAIATILPADITAKIGKVLG